MTRRDFIGAGMGFVASAAMGRPIRSSIGGRMEYGEEGLKPYDNVVEYLESTGTQWIDTGIVSQNSLHYEFYLIESSGNNQSRFFGFSELKDSWIFSGINEINFGPTWLYVTFAKTEYNTRIAYPNRNGFYEIDFTDGDAYFKLNGSTKWTSTKTGSYNGSARVYVFNEYGRTGAGKGKLFFMQISKYGKLLFDGRPVRFTNEYGIAEGAMYDIVTGQLFRNQGTGSFIIGPDAY